MTISTTAMALNAAIGVAVWMSELSLLAKIILTVLLVVKHVVFFYTAWMGDSEAVQKIGSVVLFLMNIGIIVYALVCREIHIAITAAITLIMLGVWSFSTVFDFNFKKKD